MTARAERPIAFEERGWWADRTGTAVLAPGLPQYHSPCEGWGTRAVGITETDQGRAPDTSVVTGRRTETQLR